jgi:hypothetical protein
MNILDLLMFMTNFILSVKITFYCVHFLHTTCAFTDKDHKVVRGLCQFEYG